LPTINPIAKIKFMIAEYPIIKPSPNKITPDIKAMIVKPITNLVIYFLKPDYYVLAFAAKFAI
jgi:hypothetical protein